jgi:hypothetical protein
MTNYETDFYGWTQEQAALLRAGRLTDLDIANLIEEVETMGRSEKRALESRMTVLLLHLLKWHYQPDRRSRSWQLTIRHQRLKYTKLLKDNPGLKPHLIAILEDAYSSAVLFAAEETHKDEFDFPTQCPWDYEQIIDSNFFPD